MKRNYDAKRAEIVKVLAKRFSREPDTIRKAIRGDLKSPLAEDICKAYNDLYAKVSNALA